VAKSQERPIIYLIGASGVPNYGDELITAGWLRYYAEVLPETEVWVDGPRPGQSSVLHGDIHPRARFVDTLYHGCWNAPSEKVEDLLDFGERVANDPGLLPREATGIEEFQRVALVHVMGGAYLNGMWPRHFLLLGAALGIARARGVPAVLTGAALTPLPAVGSDALLKLLSDFDIIDVRDKATLAAISDSVPHATCTGDDALLFAGQDYLNHQTRDKVLIAVQNDMLTAPLEQVADYVTRTLQLWNVADSRVTIVESLPPDDISLLPLLSESLPKVDVLPFSHLWRSHFPAAPRARWIATRYHAHLMGAIAGGWGVVLPVGGDAVSSSPTDLIDQGSGWAIAPDLENPLPANRSTGVAFGGKLPRMRSAKQAVASTIVAKAREARAAQTTPR